MRPDVLAVTLAESVKGLVEPLQQRIAQADATLAALTTEIAALKAQAVIPGPPGPAGPPGLDGKDGAGFEYLGAHVRGATYEKGQVVTAGGSMFHCNRTTDEAPGTSKDWTLAVKHGQDLRGLK